MNTNNDDDRCSAAAAINIIKLCTLSTAGRPCSTQ